jgi:hypothetical protein
VPAVISAQRVVRGVVRGPNGPLSSVNVFDVETLDGVITRESGAFSIVIRDTARTSIALAARRVGFKPVNTIVPVGDSVEIVMEPLAALSPVNVLAGRFTAGTERSSALTPLEVMTTPGGGDVNAAVKTLPGVQTVDEGSGLFVRGGDYTETRTFIDGAPMFSAYQLETPTGSVAGTINPFLTDGITFSAGGFGAQWGNALSGIVDLHPLGRPQSTSASVNATLLSVGAGMQLRLDHGLGFSATAGASDLSALLAVNGNPRRFDPPPHGNTLSAQGTWEFSPSGRVLLFALRQRNAMGVEVDDPELSSTYSTARLSDIVVASLRDTVGRWRPFVALSTSGLARTDTQSVYRSASTLRSWQARAELGYEWSPRIAALAGVEAERLSADYETRTPVRGYDDLPGAPVVQSSLDRAGARDAGYAQIEGWPLPSLDVVAGARTDRSRFATDRTVDPRLSAAWHATSAVVFTASWGVYHQLADPAFIDLTSTREDLPALRADMAIAGAQIGTGARFARVEAWTKRYDDLVALTRDFRAVPGLAGNARGLDLFARSDGPAGTRLRLTWSVSRSRRTDPNTLLDAPAPYDVTNTITGVIERDWSNGWHLGFAQRFATGRPFTDVVSAAYDSTRGVFAPAFGPPNAGRLPDYRRADIAVSRARSLSGGRFLVIFGAIQNPFNSLNLYGYTWTRDYAERVPVRTSVNRTLFIGANLVQSKNP